MRYSSGELRSLFLSIPLISLHTVLKESIHLPNLEEVLHMHNPFHSCFRLNSILIMQLTVAQAITSMFSLDGVKRWVIIFECN